MSEVSLRKDSFHWHLSPGDVVYPSEFTMSGTVTEVETAGIYRINTDGTIEPWGAVATEDRCEYCLAEFARAVAP